MNFIRRLIRRYRQWRLNRATRKLIKENPGMIYGGGYPMMDLMKKMGERKNVTPE